MIGAGVVATAKGSANRAAVCRSRAISPKPIEHDLGLSCLDLDACRLVANNGRRSGDAGGTDGCA